MAGLEIQNLGKFHPGAAGWSLRGASLTVAEGELLAVVGPSGAGKTTLLRLVAGLDRPTEGSIFIGGQRVNEVEPQDRDVAMVFQNQALFPHLTAYQNLALGLRLRKTPRPEIERRVGEAVQWLDLRSCLDRKPGTLSGGERQRVALGRALVRHPAVFLLDEPLSSLDVPARLQLREEILRLHKRLRLAMIYVTHDQGEAMAVGDRIAVLRQGVIQQVAAPLEIYRRPASQFVAGFLGSPRMNFWRGLLLRRDGRVWFHSPADGTGAGAELRLEIPRPAPGLIEPHLGRPVILGVRAEHVVCQERPAGGAASLAGIVETAEFTGANTWVSLRLEDLSPASSPSRAGDPQTLRMVARSAGQATWASGQKVAVDVDLTQAHFFDSETGARIGPG